MFALMVRCLNSSGCMRNLHLTDDLEMCALMVPCLNSTRYMRNMQLYTNDSTFVSSIRQVNILSVTWNDSMFL